MLILIMPTLGKLSSTDYTVFLSIVAAVPFTPTVISFLPTSVPATVRLFLDSIRIPTAATTFAIAAFAFAALTTAVATAFAAVIVTAAAFAATAATAAATATAAAAADAATAAAAVSSSLRLVAHPPSPAPGAWWCIFYPVVCVSHGEVDSTFESTPAVYVAAAAPVVQLAPPLSSANPTATPNASIHLKSTNALAAVSQHYCYDQENNTEKGDIFLRCTCRFPKHLVRVPLEKLGARSSEESFQFIWFFFWFEPNTFLRMPALDEMSIENREKQSWQDCGDEENISKRSV
jgi:hypothetical protein